MSQKLARRELAARAKPWPLSIPRAPIRSLNWSAGLSRVAAWATLPKLAVGLLFALAFLLTILPYTIYKPYFPFTGDFQHPDNVASLMEHGEPYPVTPAYLKEQYPDTYGFLGATVGELTGLDPLTALIVLSSATMLATLGAVYVLTFQLYGQRAAIFALFAYGILSYQPRQTYYDGTYIELVSGLILTPLFLLALWKSLMEKDWRWPVVAGALAATLVRYHFIGTVQAAATSALFLAGIALFRRDVLTRHLLARLGVMLGIAFALSMPYSFYYVRIGGRILLGRLGLLPVASEQEGVFPALSFPGDFYTKLGVVFYHVALLALGALAIKRFTARKVQTSDLLIMAWLIVLVLGSVTRVFIVPERFLRNVALPASVLIGIFLAMLRGRTAVVAVSLTVVLVPSLIFVGRRVSEHSANLMAGIPDDLPSLQALHEIRKLQPDKLVLSDESGAWASHFAERNTFYLHGGPDSFAWNGEPIRTQSFNLWGAYRVPCMDSSIRTFEQYNVGFVYLGRKPSHWYPPGFEFQDGSRFLSCPMFEPLYVETVEHSFPASGESYINRYHIFRLKTAAEEFASRPAWVPAEGLQTWNIHTVEPPLPDGDADASYYRRWYALTRIANASVLGYPSNAPPDFLVAAPDQSLQVLFQDALEIRRARQAGVKSPLTAPEYDLRLWREFGQPAAWPPDTMTDGDLQSISITDPNPTLSSVPVQRWYEANYKRLQHVYYGDRPPNLEALRSWAQTHSDAELVYEINAMRLADAAGIVGDPNDEQTAFKAWLADFQRGGTTSPASSPDDVAPSAPPTPSP